MSAIAFFGAVELGLVYAFVGLGVFLAFRVLDFPDLTVDGSFPLGAAVSAVLIIAGVNPWLATLAAILAGSCAGLVTAFLNVRFKILHLLASILTMIALFSINLRIMGRPNVALLTEQTMLTPFYDRGLANYLVRPLFLAVLVAIAVALLAWFLRTDFGLAMRATGANPKMARAQGIATGRSIYAGMALSNGAGRPRRGALRPDQRLRRRDLRDRHHRRRARRGHRRRDALPHPQPDHRAGRLRRRLDPLPDRHPVGALLQRDRAASRPTSISSPRFSSRWR